MQKHWFFLLEINDLLIDGNFWRVTICRITDRTKAAGNGGGHLVSRDVVYGSARPRSSFGEGDRGK